MEPHFVHKRLQITHVLEGRAVADSHARLPDLVAGWAYTGFQIDAHLEEKAVSRFDEGFELIEVHHQSMEDVTDLDQSGRILRYVSGFIPMVCLP